MKTILNIKSNSKVLLLSRCTLDRELVNLYGNVHGKIVWSSLAFYTEIQIPERTPYNKRYIANFTKVHEKNRAEFHLMSWR